MKGEIGCKFRKNLPKVEEVNFFSFTLDTLDLSLDYSQILRLYRQPFYFPLPPFHALKDQEMGIRDAIALRTGFSNGKDFQALRDLPDLSGK